MNLDRSISNLSKRIDRLDSLNADNNDSNRWRGKEIIPLSEWIQLRETPYVLECFPDDYDEFRTFLTESDLIESDEETRKWYSDYLDLMDYKRNSNYGKSKCFHCLLSPGGDDPIFIGINRLVAKGLEDDKSDKTNKSPVYPCRIENRFECPYEKGKESDTRFNVDDLFELASMAFAVEIALAVARKDSSGIQIKNKEDLYQALTNLEMFVVVLEQGLDYISSDKEMFEDKSCFEILKKGNRDKIVDYFTNVKDKVKLEELIFY